MQPQSITTDMEWKCRYCDERLIERELHRYVAPDRDVFPTSVLGVDCNEGECLNAAGQVTKHHPA